MRWSPPFRFQLVQLSLTTYDLSVGSVKPADGEGDLHYGAVLIMPGKIGDGYFMTKGHLHAWQPAAEFYFGLSGEGVVLLEDERSGESRIVPLLPDCAVYVPGHTHGAPHDEYWPRTADLHRRLSGTRGP